MCSSPRDSVHVCVYCIYQYTRLTGLANDVTYFLSVLSREVTTGRGSNDLLVPVPKCIFHLSSAEARINSNARALHSGFTRLLQYLNSTEWI